VALHRQHCQSRTPAFRGRKRGAAAQAIGRSRGGVSTKVHLVVDALGLPVAFEITEGQRHDNQAAPRLIDLTSPTCLLADKGYDSNAIRSKLAAIGCMAVIPSTASRIPKLPYDHALYRARSQIECTLNLLKQARRFATRYEKTSRNYAAVVALGCALLWLRV
jgi:transposase